MKIYFKTPIGNLFIEESANKITAIGLSPNIIMTGVSRLLLTAKKQLQEYFVGKRKVFDIPVAFRGTAYQIAVWKQLLLLPYGGTASYSEVAFSMGNKKAARSVGAACRCNPLMIIVPCHRVIGKNKKLTGYAGGLDIKEKLLILEKKYAAADGNI